MERKSRIFERLVIALLALPAWPGAGRRSAAAEIVLDCTVSQELADVNAKPFPGVYHLWNLGDDGKTIPRAVWQPAFDRVAKGEDVWLDIEPKHTKPEWIQDVDPSKTTPEKLKATHAIVAKQLEPLCRLAEQTGARVWLYGLFLPTYTRVEDIVNDPRQWEADARKAIGVKYDGTKTLARLVNATGGGVLFEVYIPDGWNRPDGWAVAKGLLLLERQAALLAELGVRGIPLLNLNTIGGKPVTTETLRALIFAGKSRGRIAVWNGFGGGEGFAKFTPEQKRWLK